MSYHICTYTYPQVGLAPIKKRMIKEIGKYGLDKKFTRAEADSIKQASKEIQRRLVCVFYSKDGQVF